MKRLELNERNRWTVERINNIVRFKNVFIYDMQNRQKVFREDMIPVHIK